MLTLRWIVGIGLILVPVSAFLAFVIEAMVEAPMLRWIFGAVAVAVTMLVCGAAIIPQKSE